MLYASLTNLCFYARARDKHVLCCRLEKLERTSTSSVTDPSHISLTGELWLTPSQICRRTHTYVRTSISIYPLYPSAVRSLMHPLTLHSSTSGPALKEPSPSEGISRLLLIWKRSDSKCLSHDKFSRSGVGAEEKKKSDLGWFEQRTADKQVIDAGANRTQQLTQMLRFGVRVSQASRQTAFKTAAEIPPRCQTADNNVV